MSMPGIIMQIIASLLVGPLWNMENISNRDNAVPLNINSDRIKKSKSSTPIWCYSEKKN